MRAIHVHNLSFNYSKSRPLFQNVNLSLPAHSINLIIGPSGTGKSTFLKCLARLFPRFSNGKLSGKINYGSTPLQNIPHAKLSRLVTMLFQDPNQEFTMPTVKDELIFTLENLRTPPRQIPITLSQSLKRVGMSNFKDRHISTLSGGEKQRAALAITLAMDSSVILLDEPFTNVDSATRSLILQQLTELKRQGKTIIIVDHNLAGYLPVVDYTFQMKNQTIYPVANQILRPKTHPRTRWSLPNHLSSAFNCRQLKLQRTHRTLINLANVNLYRNRITLLTGANGSGKSTFFKALSKLFPYQGSITYLGKENQTIQKRNYYRQINLGFQSANDQFLKITVKEELQLSVRNSIHNFYSRTTLNSWLKQTGLSHHLQQVVYTLSGGQKKALQIMIMLLMGAPVMLMDEPFQSMDQHLIQFFAHLLKRAARDNHLTLIIISHQIQGIAKLFDYHLKINDLDLEYTKELH